MEHLDCKGSLVYLVKIGHRTRSCIIPGKNSSVSFHSKPFSARALLEEGAKEDILDKRSPSSCER